MVQKEARRQRLDERTVELRPYYGAGQTIEVIRRSCREAQTKPVVRELVESVTKDLISKDVISEALAFYYLVLHHTRYMRDPRNVELVRAPWVVAEDILAGRTPGLDCDDMAGFLCALAATSGAECRVLTVAFRDLFFRKQRQFSHVFAQVKEPRTNVWITLDPVAADRTAQMHRRIVAAKSWAIA